MAEEGKALLEKAYKNAKNLVDQGIQIFPKILSEIWDLIVFQVDTGYGIDEACYSGAREYSEIREIEMEAAFSTVVCSFGIFPRSSEWHEIMAHYHVMEAEQARNRENLPDING